MVTAEQAPGVCSPSLPQWSRLDQDFWEILPGPDQEHPGQHGEEADGEPRDEVHLGRDLLPVPLVGGAACRSERECSEAARWWEARGGDWWECHARQG